MLLEEVLGNHITVKTASAGAEEGKEMPFIVPMKIYPDSSKAQIRGKPSLFSSTESCALLWTIFHACQGRGTFSSPLLQQSEKSPGLFSGNCSNHLTSDRGAPVWCLVVLLRDLKLCIPTPPPVTSPVAHPHRTAVNQPWELTVPGLPKAVLVLKDFTFQLG